MIDDEYPLGFRLALHRKDLAIALEMAARWAWSCRSRRSRPPSRTGCWPHGHGDEDMSVLARAIRGDGEPTG